VQAYARDPANAWISPEVDGRSWSDPGWANGGTTELPSQRRLYILSFDSQPANLGLEVVRYCGNPAHLKVDWAYTSLGPNGVYQDLFGCDDGPPLSANDSWTELDVRFDTCTHAICASGPALDGACNTCATQICTVDPYCCTNAWDDICVGEVASVCAWSCRSGY
jgi:hypothetical protein